MAAPIANPVPAAESEVREVHAGNCRDSFALLEALAVNFPLIAVDCEFPGRLDERRIVPGDSDAAYNILKYNIDNTECIQLGFALANNEGQIAPFHFNFNFEFDLNDPLKYRVNQRSIDFLHQENFDFSFSGTQEIGIEPEKKEIGINRSVFRAICAESNLFKPPRRFSWIFFDGAYDIAHFWKLVTQEALPATHTTFRRKCLQVFDHDLYDVLTMKFACVPHIEGFGLNAIAQTLEVARIGLPHRAGSDALLTLRVFFEMLHRQIHGRGVDRQEWLSLHVSKIQSLFYF